MFSACACESPNKRTLLFTRRVLDEHFSTRPIYFVLFIFREFVSLVAGLRVCGVV